MGERERSCERGSRDERDEALSKVVLEATRTGRDKEFILRWSAGRNSPGDTLILAMELTDACFLEGKL